MKTIKIIFALLAINNMAYAQIEIEDKSKEPEIKAIPYTGDFMSFEGIYDKEKKAGTVGEQVTLLDVSTYNIYESEEALKNMKSISYKLEDMFKNKTFEVLSYKYDIYDILKIKNDSNIFIWKVSSSDKYVFNKYLETTKTKFEGKTFIPLHMASTFEAMNGSKLTIDGTKKYKVTKVKFAKLQYDYGIVFTLNDSIDCVFPTGSYDQPRIFNGKIYTENENYININSNDIFNTQVTLIEESEFAIFSQKNKYYLNKMRNRKVQIGMNEKQCRWAWGIPSKSMKNIAGYDEVLIYGSAGNSQNLYFKGGILKLIK